MQKYHKNQYFTIKRIFKKLKSKFDIKLKAEEELI